MTTCDVLLQRKAFLHGGDCGRIRGRTTPTKFPIVLFQPIPGMTNERETTRTNPSWSTSPVTIDSPAMIPRLTPRRSSRLARQAAAAGVENNSSPFLSSDTQHVYKRDAMELESSVAVHTPRREVLSNKHASINPPLSPCPALEELALKSPLPSDYSDCSLTPPVTGPRPLVVSAKRLGNDVRRRHSKRRRCRSRPNDGGFCLWKDANAPPSQESDSEEELPFLLPLPLQKQTQHYWEFCYGSTTMHPCPSWSANRKPPSKGW